MVHIQDDEAARADDGIRTRDPHLGKVMLYQLSHVRADAAASGLTIADIIAPGQSQGAALLQRPGIGMITDVEAVGLRGLQAPCARFAGLVATDLREVSHDPSVLDSGGRWVVVATYEGEFTAARFAQWRPGPAEAVAGGWVGPEHRGWRSSMSREQYLAAVGEVRECIARGEVYQANVCRILSAHLPQPQGADLGGLHALLARGNPAPYQGFLRLPGLQIATASPELFLERLGGRVRTGPIKGTGRAASDLQTKDSAENVMIVDLMRNDLSRICRTGSVSVPRLLEQEQHPGLVHLVSEVVGHLRPGTDWPAIFDALLPPGSVSGAPKSSAVRILRAVEPVARGPYCGAIGWVDADSGRAVLGVGIRTFWTEGDGLLHFGTGAGITWGSDPLREWQETELKASHLLAVAAGQWPPSGDPGRSSR